MPNLDLGTIERCVALDISVHYLNPSERDEECHRVKGNIFMGSVGDGLPTEA